MNIIISLSEDNMRIAIAKKRKKTSKSIITKKKERLHRRYDNNNFYSCHRTTLRFNFDERLEALNAFFLDTVSMAILSALSDI